MSVTHTQILGLYRRLLRQGSQFHAFNFSPFHVWFPGWKLKQNQVHAYLVESMRRNQSSLARPLLTSKESCLNVVLISFCQKLERKYALRRVRDYFKERKVLTDPQQIEHEYHYGLQSLEMLKRQTALSNMYHAPKLVVEPL